MIYEIRNINSKFDLTYILKSNKKFLIWDLIQINSDFFLIKWNNWIWKEILWNPEYIWNLFSPTTILFQNFISSYWYTRYFKIFHLYIQNTKYFKKLTLPIIKRQKKINIQWEYICKYSNFEDYKNYLKMWDSSIKIIDYNYFDKYKPWKWQNLFVFPNLRSLYNFKNNINFSYDILNISWTHLYRTKMFLDIKIWKTKNIFTTHAWVFQDWHKLNDIFIFDPYKWYYKNQQNPRYYLPEIAKQLKFFYNANNLYYVVV